MNRRCFIALAAALALTACGNGEPHFNHPDLKASQILPTANLFDGEGRPRNFSEFRDKAVIVLFGYTNCPETCPAALRKYASLIRNLRDKEAERVQLVFISIDPERDTPEKTDTYAKWFNPKFLGLSGTDEQIAEVARQFNVVYRKKQTEGSANYRFEHGTDAYLIDPRGQLRLAIPEAALIEPIAADLRQLLTEP